MNLGPIPDEETQTRNRMISEYARQRAERELREGSRLVTEFITIAGDLVLEMGGEKYLPLWQYDNTGTPLPGIRAARDAFSGDDVAFAEWMLRPCTHLGGRVPLQMLERGHIDTLLRFLIGLGYW